MFDENDIEAGAAAGRKYLEEIGVSSYVSDDKLKAFVQAVVDGIERNREERP